LERGRVKDEEVILIKPYGKSTTTSKTTESSVIYEEIRNLEQFMKFIHSPTQTRLFKLSYIINHFGPEKNKIYNSGKK